MAKTLYTYLKQSAARMAAAMMAVAMLAGCDNAIYDDEGDCDIHYRLRFRFDHNLLFSDAFSSQVHSVAVYAFNPDGTFAWQREESGWDLATQGYTMSLDGVAPGEYTLIGWCGMDNSFIESRAESFTLPELIPGETTMQVLKCMMEREIREDLSHHSSVDLWPLFHGTTEDVEIIDPDSYEADGQTVVYEMPLKKNTNRVRVILQQLSGVDIDADKFTYTIETDNGTMGHDNEVLDHTTITYHEWNKEEGVGGIIVDGSGEPAPAGAGARGVTQAKAAIADLTVARLIKGRATTLTVYNPDGKVAASIPLVDYALMTKGNYDTPIPAQQMTDQEFLDREDTYTLTFFLDPDLMWSGVSVWINSWRVISKDVEIHTN